MRRTNVRKAWSQCSRDHLYSSMRRGIGSCLMNVPDKSTLYGGPKCGNEIIEKDEECDCGSPEDCDRLVVSGGACSNK